MRGNTITIALQKGTVNRTASLFQYDYGQKIDFTGVELPVAYEVHFSNAETGKSKTAIGNADGVEIPDEYLESGQPVHVWIYLHDTESDGETEYHAVINVIKRAEPTDYELKPIQQDAVTQAIAALEAAVEQTGLDVVSTGKAKEAAETAQGIAEDSSLKAEGYAVGTQDGEAVTDESIYYHNNTKYYWEQTRNKAHDAVESAEHAGKSEQNAREDALKAEGYAVGKQGGTDVESGSPYYHGNAKYYKEQSEQIAGEVRGQTDGIHADALKAEGYAVGKQDGSDVPSGSQYYHNNAEYYKDQASESARQAGEYASSMESSVAAASGYAGSAGNDARSAEEDALKSEGHAVGTQDGAAVSSDSPYYRNNSKYYSEQANTFAQNAQIAMGRYPRIQYGYWYVYDPAYGVWTNTGVKATGVDGADGADGFSPIANVTKNGDKVTISITDESGTTTAEIDDPDEKADKADTVLETTLSRGRQAGTAVGTGSVAFGNNVEASGEYSHAEGGGAPGLRPRGGRSVPGRYSTAEGNYSHAEGYGTFAGGQGSHAEGKFASAKGDASHAQGIETMVDQEAAFVTGKYNKLVYNGDAWVSDHEYAVNDIVTVNGIGYKCIQAHTSATRTSPTGLLGANFWTDDVQSATNLAMMVGNGTSSNRSNAFELGWDGEAKFAGNVYSNGSKLSPIPQGGASGQVLAKASGTDYDTEWVDQSGSSGEGLVAEGYAVGTQNGTPVDSESPYYHNNAAYHNGEAGSAALAAEGYAVGKQNGVDVQSGSSYFENNAKYWALQAEDAAGSIESASIADTLAYLGIT